MVQYLSALDYRRLEASFQDSKGKKNMPLIADFDKKLEISN